jgi:gamma-glutamylcyclotransferase
MTPPTPLPRQVSTTAPSEHDPTASSAQAKRLYFAYGSNLSPTQMMTRCPGGSAPVGLARLRGWKWLINKRGYANIVLVPATSSTITTTTPSAESSVVYGLLYTLEPIDEEKLDVYEGVPRAYQKVHLDVEMVAKDGQAKEGSEVVVVVETLVYVDGVNVEPGPPRAEYVNRMNRGIREAIDGWGLDEEYVRTVLREFIPAPEGGF